MRLALLLVIWGAADCVAATASGRNWRIDIDSLSCQASLMTIEMRIRYLGPKGPAESPVSRVVDRDGKPYLPRSLVWISGEKQHAEWLARGGLANVQSEELGKFRLRFEIGAASGGLRLEFGDIRAFLLTAPGRSGCTGLLKPDQLDTPRVPRAAAPKESIRFYRRAYPCMTPSRVLQTIEAPYPPYLPRQLLVLGRGYLPSTREIELPMGRAPAQSYAYAGSDDMKGVEDAARRSMASDFPGLLKSGSFAFDWGLQLGATGNEIWSIGIYDAQPCR